MLAFIINIGLFVKAKINLQNAADAAAFAGAATQARELTNIAYVNWELRNTYKEWMFKYYIIGQAGLFGKQLSDANLSSGGTTNFLLQTPAVAGSAEFDQWNAPSICIHNGTSADICSIYVVPGIPRFPVVGVAGIAEIHEAFVSKLTTEKAKDCSLRSKTNFFAALTWAYGSGSADIPDAPELLANRPGAWLQALEIALRMRNLEMIVNRPPLPDLTRQSILRLQSQGEDIGYNERPLKAFWSGYRNLGGGAYKDCIQGTKCTKTVGEELSANFKLTELAPKTFTPRANSVSTFLIPPDAQYPGGGSPAFEKRYLDLQVMTVNLAPLFTTFVSTTNNNTAIGGTPSEATCGMSRTALPVPGYILGFNKNPEVLTYYAVKAESKFIGLFFPNGSSPANEGFKLTAYAAAKPFGGRIGPKLFGFGDDTKSENFINVKSRNGDFKRSLNFVTGLTCPTCAIFKPGMPIPISPNFWASSINNTLGGIPGSGANVFFSIPNMIYDFSSPADLDEQAGSTGPSEVLEIEALTAPSLIKNGGTGLYYKNQIKALKASLGPVSPGDSLDSARMYKALVRSRRPTQYDAINYLIPDFRDPTLGGGSNAAPLAQRVGPVPTENVGYKYKLFAPLFGDSLLYKNAPSVQASIIEYVNMMKPSVVTYLSALYDVATSVYNTPTTKNSKLLQEAGLSIHSGAGGAGPIPLPLNSADCKTDLATRFNHFFTSEVSVCGFVPLKAEALEYLKKMDVVDPGLNPKMYYFSDYYYEPNSPLNLSADKLLTAYYPGTRQGTNPGEMGIASHPLGLGADYSTRRNYYSTKFFHMAKIMDGAPTAEFTSGKNDFEKDPALREDEKKIPSDLSGGKVEIKNSLPYNDPSLNNKYFLDF